MDVLIEEVAAQVVWVSEALIPPDPEGGMPSASEANVPTVLLPRALKARPEFVLPFVSAMARLPADAPADPLFAIRALGAEDFEMVSHLIAGAYFLDDDINRRLRYPGQQALTDTPDYDEVMDVVQRVIDRGPTYVDVN